MGVHGSKLPRHSVVIGTLIKEDINGYRIKKDWYINGFFGIRKYVGRKVCIQGRRDGFAHLDVIRIIALEPDPKKDPVTVMNPYPTVWRPALFLSRLLNAIIPRSKPGSPPPHSDAKSDHSDKPSDDA